MELSGININDYTYGLTDERIAKYPLENRDESKLLIYNKGKLSHTEFKNIVDPDYLNKFIVFNNTKVIRARLHFRKVTGAKIEIFCLEPHEPSDYNLVFQSNKKCKWKCVTGNLKKWKSGPLTKEISLNGLKSELRAEKISSGNGAQIIEFSWNNPDLTFADILENSGQTPIPPYLKRESENSDTLRYQTVYSLHKGSVAAPTAGLHFTDRVLNKFKEKGIKTGFVTLHVGAGTFKPVQEEKIIDHEMHTEHFSVHRNFIEDLIENNGKLTITGTTSVRTLESLYYLGIKIKQNPALTDLNIDQWEVYKMKDNLSVKEAMEELLKFSDKHKTEHIRASTKIMIVPGYRFKLTDQLITNFHQPKSTLLLLIAAFIGKDWRKVYEYALNNDFRFLSYGDSSLLIPQTNYDLQ